MDDFMATIQSDEVATWNEEDFDPAFFWDEN